MRNSEEISNPLHFHLKSTLKYSKFGKDLDKYQPITSMHFEYMTPRDPEAILRVKLKGASLMRAAKPNTKFGNIIKGKSDTTASNFNTEEYKISQIESIDSRKRNQLEKIKEIQNRSRIKYVLDLNPKFEAVHEKMPSFTIGLARSVQPSNKQITNLKLNLNPRRTSLLNAKLKVANYSKDELSIANEDEESFAEPNNDSNISNDHKSNIFLRTSSSQGNVIDSNLARYYNSLRALQNRKTMVLSNKDQPSTQKDCTNSNNCLGKQQKTEANSVKLNSKIKKGNSPNKSLEKPNKIPIKVSNSSSKIKSINFPSIGHYNPKYDYTRETKNICTLYYINCFRRKLQLEVSCD